MIRYLCLMRLRQSKARAGAALPVPVIALVMT